MVHSCVGCSVTPKCSTRRRWCESTIRTNKTWKVALWYGEKVDGRSLGQMVGQERSPGLGGRFPRTRQIPSHRRLRHRNPQLAEFPMNAGCAPQRVGLAHAPYEIASVLRHLWSSRALPRFAGPIPGKGSPVPADHGRGLHDLQAGAPTRPAAREQDPQPSVGALQAQTRWRVLVEHGQLVTKGENLSLQGGTGPKTGGEKSEKSNQNRVHRGCKPSSHE